MSFIATPTAAQPRFRTMLDGRDIVRPLIRVILREVDLSPEDFLQVLNQC